VKPQRPAAAAAGANEKTPAAVIGKTAVLEANEEGRASRERDSRGCVVGMDEALSPHAGDADAGEIVDHYPHERETSAWQWESA
jgi:hypothetical protein